MENFLKNEVIMKKKFFIIILLGITATQMSALPRVFELADPEERTERWSHSFDRYKDNVIAAINNSINVDMEPAKTVYQSQDGDRKLKKITLFGLLNQAQAAHNEDELEAVDYHYQNTLYLIHVHD